MKDQIQYKKAMLVQLDHLIQMALAEDLSDLGDVTSESIFGDEKGYFSLYSKDCGVFCGEEVILRVFKAVDPSLSLHFYFHDGDDLSPGDLVMDIDGKVVSILKGERTAINFCGFLSGMASVASLLAQKAPKGLTILDTRKTLPGYRLLSKYAIKCGKASNHRIGLYDMVMIKDNHIDAAGSIMEAVSRVRQRWGDRFAIEVETRNLEEVQEALDLDVDRIMLDNMSDKLMSQAVKLIAGKAESEASGNMSVDRLEGVGQAGVDFVSFGSITHSVSTFDFSLKEKL